ncbi:MAG: cob(I)yrinic acid a,c-diamide adenosyltransferase [Anaerolineae bacterium]|nr:cob(I)yrinic acid a,c-diamide adenosyltransferase [Anaerolineae bacterium]
MGKTLFFTGKGDRGDTARLGGAGRLPKNAALIDTIGAIDEATCAIGLARAQVQDPILQTALPEVQRRIYRLMSHLSATPETRATYTGLVDTDVSWLENLIAELEEHLPELTGFVLPGDSPTGAACHVARATIRRAERRLVAFNDLEPGIGPANLAFMNRLSSLMFVAALREDGLAERPLTLARSQATIPVKSP